MYICVHVHVYTGTYMSCSTVVHSCVDINMHLFIFILLFYYNMHIISYTYTYIHVHTVHLFFSSVVMESNIRLGTMRPCNSKYTAKCSTFSHHLIDGTMVGPLQKTESQDVPFHQ